MRKALIALWHSQGAIARAMLRGSASGVALSVGNRLVTLVSGALIARSLGVDEFGIYSLAIATAMIAGVLAEFGLPTLLVREVARADPVARPQIVRDGMIAVCITGGVVAAIGIVAIYSFCHQIGHAQCTAFVVIAGLVPLAATNRVLSAALIGRGKVVYAQLSELLIAPAVVLGGAVALWLKLMHPSAERALGVQVAANAISVVLAASWTQYIVRAETLTTMDARRALSSLVAGAPFLATSMAMLLSTQVDLVVLGFVGSHEDVALYRVGAQGATFCTFGGQVLQTVASPLFSKLHTTGDREGFRRLFRAIQGLMAGSALIVAGIFLVAGQEVISFLFGASYKPAQTTLVIISVGFVLNAACGPIGVALQMTGHERAMSRIVWATAIANVGAAVLLGIAAGAAGVAVATACSLTAYHLIMRIYARDLLRL